MISRGETFKNESQPISRVLSWTTIPLGYASPHTSSNLPGSNAGRTNGSLFGLAPGGVCRAVECYHPRGVLLPHPFALTLLFRTLTYFYVRRFTFCCTFRRLAPPRRYLAPYPVEPGLSSRASKCSSDCLADSQADKDRDYPPNKQI